MKLKVILTIAAMAVSVLVTVGVCLASDPPIDIDFPEKRNQLSGTVEVGAIVKPGVEVKVVEFFCDGSSIGSDDTDAVQHHVGHHHGRGRQAQGPCGWHNPGWGEAEVTTCCCLRGQQARRRQGPV